MFNLEKVLCNMYIVYCDLIFSDFLKKNSLGKSRVLSLLIFLLRKISWLSQSLILLMEDLKSRKFEKIDLGLVVIEALISISITYRTYYSQKF